MKPVFFLIIYIVFANCSLAQIACVEPTTKNEFTLTLQGAPQAVNNCSCRWTSPTNTQKYTDATYGTIIKTTLRYSIFYGRDNAGTLHTKLYKPILLIAGFDPFGSYSCNELYDKFDDRTINSFTSGLRRSGYDIITVYWSNSLLPIQANAYLLADFLEQFVNNPTNKEGNADNVIIAESMGGLIARYTLAYMEQQNRAHNVRLYASLDAPHRGANMPIGLQSMLYTYYKSPLVQFGSVYSQELSQFYVALVASNAAPSIRQMLLYKVSYTDFTNDYILPDPYHESLYTEIATLNGSGFPKKCTNIAASLGNLKCIWTEKSQWSVCNSWRKSLGH